MAPEQMNFQFDKAERRKFIPGPVSEEDFETILQMVQEDHPDWDEEGVKAYANAVRGMIEEEGKKKKATEAEQNRFKD